MASETIIPPVILESLQNTCQLSQTQHFWVVVVVQIFVQLTLALINYFGFTINPATRANTMFQWFINILRKIIFALFKRESK